MYKEGKKINEIYIQSIVSGGKRKGKEKRRCLDAHFLSRLDVTSSANNKGEKIK
jgi:hypothetical protein